VDTYSRPTRGHSSFPRMRRLPPLPRGWGRRRVGPWFAFTALDLCHLPSQGACLVRCRSRLLGTRRRLSTVSRPRAQPAPSRLSGSQTTARTTQPRRKFFPIMVRFSPRHRLTAHASDPCTHTHTRTHAHTHTYALPRPLSCTLVDGKGTVCLMHTAETDAPIPFPFHRIQLLLQLVSRSRL